MPFDVFVRCIGLGPQLRCVNYDPDAPLHDRYRMDVDFLAAEGATAPGQDMTMVINAFFGWDFNSCESLRQRWRLASRSISPTPAPTRRSPRCTTIFPWLIKANLRWSIFCAATKRRMNTNLTGSEYFDIADQDMPFDEKLAGYVKIARKRFDVDEFEEFCDKHLSHLDEVAACILWRPTACAMRSARKSKRCIRNMRSTSSPSCSGIASRTWREHEQGADMHERYLPLVLASARTGSATGALGALRHARCCCFRPPAATPRKSSAFT